LSVKKTFYLVRDKYIHLESDMWYRGESVDTLSSPCLFILFFSKDNMEITRFIL